MQEEDLIGITLSMTLKNVGMTQTTGLSRGYARAVKITPDEGEEFETSPPSEDCRKSKKKKERTPPLSQQSCPRNAPKLPASKETKWQIAAGRKAKKKRPKQA